MVLSIKQSMHDNNFYGDVILRIIYSFLFYLLMPFILLRLWWRGFKNPIVRKRIKERLGIFDCPKNFQHGIWIHSVSVGETITAIPLVRALFDLYPDTPIVITTMTATGSERVKAAIGEKAFHVFVPYDAPYFVKRFFKNVKPKLTIIMETEIWPNIIFYSKKFHVPVILANARLSEKSLHQYLKVKKFIRGVLKNIAVIAAQTEIDKINFQKLLANDYDNKIILTGSLKFDMPLSPSVQEAGNLLRHKLGENRKIFIAASTHEGEEVQILSALKKIKKEVANVLLILVPRHPERFKEVYTLCKKQNFKIITRSSKQNCTANTDIFFADSMGELLTFYAASDVAFVGGSLVKHGGHNFLEPAIFKLPIISGRHVFNFKHMVDMFVAANAITIVNNSEELAKMSVKFFLDDDLCFESGIKAYNFVLQNRGALEKHLQIIAQFL